MPPTLTTPLVTSSMPLRQVEQGGLAAAGGAHDRYHVGLGHGKLEASQRLDLESIRLVGFDQIDGFHGRRLGLIL